MGNLSKLSKGILKEALKGKGECLTVKAGVRRQYQWKDPLNEDSDPLGDTVELIKHSQNKNSKNNIIIDFLCDESGGYFVPYEESTVSSRNAHAELGGMLKEITDVYVVCGEAMKDGKISTEESNSIKKECKEAMQRMVSFMECIESGRFE